MEITKENSLEKATKIIKRGGIIICPTDTVYGLLCDAANGKAVENIFKIKKRDKSNPLPIFVSSLAMAKKLAYIDKKQENFLNEVWPGKVTVVLKRKPNCGLPEILFGGKQTIALRVPNYKLIAGIIKKLKMPLAQTSANISGKPASTEIKEVLRQFKTQKDKPDLVIDAGDLPESKPSKIIDLTENKVIILRK